MFHNLAVDMPGRVAEDRQHDRQPREQWQRADDQGDGDNQSPDSHCDRVRQHHTHRGVDSFIGADVAVQQERESDDRGAQHDHGEDEADRVTENDQRPAASGGEYLVR